jgi:hemerythrin-like domain-containing protein
MVPSHAIGPMVAGPWEMFFHLTAGVNGARRSFGFRQSMIRGKNRAVRSRRFMKITQALLAEHVVFHNLFDFFERTVPKLKTLAEVRTLAALLESMMKVHSVVEDALLMEPLEPSFAQIGQQENFHDEHDEIEHDLQAIQTSLKLPEAKRLLLRCVTLSRKHFDKEERIVFPLAEEQLSNRSLLLLGKKWEQQRKSLLG